MLCLIASSSGFVVLLFLQTPLGSLEFIFVHLFGAVVWLGKYIRKVKRGPECGGMIIIMIVIIIRFFTSYCGSSMALKSFAS